MQVRCPSHGRLGRPGSRVAVHAGCVPGHCSWPRGRAGRTRNASLGPALAQLLPSLMPQPYSRRGPPASLGQPLGVTRRLSWDPEDEGRCHHHHAGLLDVNQCCVPEPLLGRPRGVRRQPGDQGRGWGADLCHYSWPWALGERRPGRELLRDPRWY